jgi:hypothetical protein
MKKKENIMCSTYFQWEESVMRCVRVILTTVKTKSFMMFCMISILLTLSGCTALVHNAVIAKYPLLHDSVVHATPLGPDYSRLVVYALRAPLAGASLLGVGGFDVLPVTIEGKTGVLHADLLDQTGFYIDVPIGEYSIQGGSFFTAVPSQTYIIRCESEIFLLSRKTPELIDQYENAMEEIKEKKIRFCAPTGGSETARFLPFRPALLPNKKADSVWKSYPMPQTRHSSVARVYVYNSVFFVGGAQRPFVGVDSLPDFEIGKKKYVVFEMSPGKHVFTAKAGMFSAAGMMPPLGFAIELKEGQDLIIEYNPTKGYRLLNEEKAGEILKDESKLHENGYYKKLL